MNEIIITESSSVDSNRSIIITPDPLIYRLATDADCDTLFTLINNTYRGELSNQGWTNENQIVSKLRIKKEKILQMITDDKHTLLVFFSESDHSLRGCIDLLYQTESNTVYLNTFAVPPDLQRQGYGKFILSIAENYALNNWNVDYIELKVMIQRSELVAYYNRRGYVDTDHYQTFSIEQLKAGGALRNDLRRSTMRKYMKDKKEK